MNYCTLLFIIVVFAAGPIVAEETLENRVLNPGFEEGGKDAVTGWKFYSWKETTGVWDDEHVYSGSRSLKIQGQNGGWSTAVPVAPGRVHQLQLRYRSEGEANKIVVYVREKDASGKLKVLQYDSMPVVPASSEGSFVDGTYIAGADANGWVTFDAGSFVGSDDVSEVSLLIKLVSDDPTANLWLDDIEVRAVPVEILPDTARLLKTLPGASVWWENENRKILPENDIPEGEPMTEISLDLAGGEYGAFQIAVTPETDWEKVDWRWSDFSGKGTADEFQMRCRRVEMIPIEKVHGPFDRKGLNPDPLTDSLPCDIPAGTNQAFWFTVSVPSEQKPGDYEKELILFSGDEEHCRIPIKLKVRRFSLPRTPSIDVYSGFRAGLVRDAEADETDIVMRRYYRTFFEHRTRCAPVASIGLKLVGDKAHVDAGKFVEELKYLRENFGGKRYFLPALWISHGGNHRMPADAQWKGRRIFSNEELTEIDPAFEVPFLDYMNQLVAELKREGIFGKPLLRFTDEPNLNDPVTVNGLRTLAELMGRIDPEITVTMTATRPHPDLIDVIKSWTLHTDAWDLNHAEIEAAREAGCIISVYNNGVNYPESESIRIRLWPWLLKKYDVDGSNSWWGTVCWRSGMEDPWTSGYTTSGVLLYPPRNPSEKGPIESVRWELFRQGLQDYEYLYLAETLAERLESEGDIEAALPGREAISAALKLVDRWPRVQPANDRPYRRDVNGVTVARQALADAIEGMQDDLEDR